MKTLIKNLAINHYWVFTLAVWATYEMIIEIIRTFKNYENMLLKDLPIFQIDFLMNIIQIITVIVMFLILKKYTKTKKEINYVATELTKNLNNANLIIDAKIKVINAYLHFLKPNVSIGYLSGFLSDDEMRLLGYSENDIKIASQSREEIKKAIDEGRI